MAKYKLLPPLALILVAILTGCGEGSSSSSSLSTLNDSESSNNSNTSNKEKNISFATFENCVVNIEESNLYGVKAVKCSENTLDTDWEIQSVEVVQTDGFKGVFLYPPSLESVNLSSDAYSLNKGEHHTLKLKVYGKNSSSKETRVMETTLKINGVEDGYNTITTKYNYPVLIIRVNLDDVKAIKSATELHNIGFGFGLDQANYTMLRNSASSRTFTPVIENEGVENDGVITVSIDESSFTQGDYQSVSAVDRYIKKAVTLADKNVDFSSYDKNSDGILTEKELSIVISFPQTSLSNTNWSAVAMRIESDYYYDSDDGIRVLYKDEDEESTNWVTCISEDEFDAGSFVHEQGHAVFGLIDLYDIDYSSVGTGNLGLMDGGENTEYNYYYIPQIMMAYSQVKAGFIIPTEISTSQSVTLLPPTLKNSHNIIKVISNREDEFFYLENYLFSSVRPMPEDAESDGAGGVLITKVNTTTDNSDTNSDELNPIVKVIASEYDDLGAIKRNFYNESDSISNVKYSDDSSSNVSFENITFNIDGSISLDVIID